ncbi:WD40 repeat [Dillenia turbinata]|uniref:Katanin p80 WD40 repeat-containing subunit B1 homolog n=1 Tax=Dillenia turbinata TaxID=194707 RepID=A0AAN8Z040_9MAGN
MQFGLEDLGVNQIHDDQTRLQAPVCEEEFVAHSSSVNCLKIGRKSSRVLSLSGHTSGIDSVSFDTSEVLVAAGAASGTIKLWDLEEAKIVRTLTGHRSNCISVDFHPFGEFFASGSLDTNLKIWDIRRKGCIHTYKGHTRGVNAIRFTPDGRWVVSGGEDNTVKLWDLTAGKLLHDFKSHEGQVQCIDFHPHEFLLATGSPASSQKELEDLSSFKLPYFVSAVHNALFSNTGSSDRTVKFWDLETFEPIGSAGPEPTGVRCMTFNPDGGTLLCGLHESLKVFSWEPIHCHDAVDVGWSKLSDLNIHEGKLLGCSYNQSCVGVWVVDITRIEPNNVGNASQLNGHPTSKSTLSGNVSVLSEDTTTKTTLGRLSVSQNSDSVVKETKALGRHSVSQNANLVKETKVLASSESVPGTPQRVNVSTGAETSLGGSVAAPIVTAPKRRNLKAQTTTNPSVFNKSDIVPVIVPRTSMRSEQASESRNEVGSVVARTMPFSLQSKVAEIKKLSNSRDDLEKPPVNGQPHNVGPKPAELTGVVDQMTFPSIKSPTRRISEVERTVKDDPFSVSGKCDSNSMVEPPTCYPHESYDNRVHKTSRNACYIEVPRGGPNSRDLSFDYEGHISGNLFGAVSAFSRVQLGSSILRGHPFSAEKETLPVTDEDVLAHIVEQHDQFVGSMQSRLAKLQIVHRYWERSDIKGTIGALEKMADHAPDFITLDTCTSLLPLLTGLLDSNMDRHLEISLEMLLKLVKMFGFVIYSTISTLSPFGVDIEGEERIERCNMCFIELEKVKRGLPAITRRGGSIAKYAQELNLILQEKQ